MKQFTIPKWIYFLAIVACAACGRSDSKKQFEISGTITNATARMVYLEEVPPGSNQGSIVDSFPLPKDGSFKLKADSKESTIYNLRLDQSGYPVAAVINDVPKMTLNAVLKAGSNEFTEKYDVKGSPASQQMKDFMFAFNNYLQEIYPIAVRGDSMRKLNVPDSAYEPIRAEWKSIADKIKSYTLNSLSKTDNAVLYIFELGYYQGSAQQRGFGLEPIPIDEELRMLNDAVIKFPGHQGLLAIKKLKEAEQTRYNEMTSAKWVGKPAPDFALPDVNGKEIRLSSFRGKFVLVDFWASWCMPCRAENPNVVKAYKAYKDKNFTILGVSLDNPGEKNNWMNAVRKDSLTWTQVSDLKGWESSVVPLYQFNGIPYNILLDPSGTVIGESLRGRALEMKLNEVLK